MKPQRTPSGPEAPKLGDYEHDVFVSYPRGGNVEPWVRKHLVPRLKSNLKENLGRDLVFIDAEGLDTGMDWPHTLSHALLHSRVLLAVISRQYFKKHWCLAELNSMLARCDPLGMGTPAAPNLLVHAVVAHDCEDVPEPYRRMQRATLKHYVYDYADPDWPFFKSFQDEVSALAARIATTVESCPQWHPDFPSLTLPPSRSVELVTLPAL